MKKYKLNLENFKKAGLELSYQLKDGIYDGNDAVEVKMGSGGYYFNIEPHNNTFFFKEYDPISDKEVEDLAGEFYKIDRKDSTKNLNDRSECLKEIYFDQARYVLENYVRKDKCTEKSDLDGHISKYKVREGFRNWLRKYLDDTVMSNAYLDSKANDFMEYFK